MGLALRQIEVEVQSANVADLEAQRQLADERADGMTSQHRIGSPCGQLGAQACDWLLLLLSSALASHQLGPAPAAIGHALRKLTADLGLLTVHIAANHAPAIDNGPGALDDARCRAPAG